MKKSKNALTHEQIEQFGQYIIHYQDLLNLRDWRIEPSGRPAGRGAMADVGISMEDRLAVYSVGADWGNMPINESTIKSTACHEVLHIFLKPLMQACFQRDEGAAEQLEHSVIVVLEKLLSK